MVQYVIVAVPIDPSLGVVPGLVVFTMVLVGGGAATICWLRRKALTAWAHIGFAAGIQVVPAITVLPFAGIVPAFAILVAPIFLWVIILGAHGAASCVEG